MHQQIIVCPGCLFTVPMVSIISFVVKEVLVESNHVTPFFGVRFFPWKLNEERRKRNKRKKEERERERERETFKDSIFLRRDRIKGNF